VQHGSVCCGCRAMANEALPFEKSTLSHHASALDYEKR
jgi:hypothetical protein